MQRDARQVVVGGVARIAIERDKWGGDVVGGGRSAHRRPGACHCVEHGSTTN